MEGFLEKGLLKPVSPSKQWEKDRRKWIKKKPQEKIFLFSKYIISDDYLNHFSLVFS